MPLPQANPSPPFNVTRAGHVVLTARDLHATRAFYEGVLGLVVSAQTEDRLFLRGIEEQGHHSLVFERHDGPRRALRMGYRVFTDADVHAAHDHFRARGMDARMVERPHQGPTLHVTDPAGFPLEIVATMEQVEAHLMRHDLQRGGRPRFFDHTQLYCPSVPTAMRFYMDLGFRMTEYIGAVDDDAPPAIWLQRKGATQDVVFNTQSGPQLHHFAYAVAGVENLIMAADIAAAKGHAAAVERGPGRHGISGALFLYFRDPDGHRVELFTDHYLAIDSDYAIKRWAPEDPAKAQIWGMPATERFYAEATPFDAPQQAPDREPVLVTLEKFLEQEARRPPG